MMKNSETLKNDINENSIEDEETNGKKETVQKGEEEQEEKKILNKKEENEGKDEEEEEEEEEKEEENKKEEEEENKKEEEEEKKEEENSKEIKKEIINKNLFLAEMAKKVNRYDESIKFLINIIKTNQRDLNFDEKEEFSFSLIKWLKKIKNEIIFFNKKIEESRKQSLCYSNCLKKLKKKSLINFIKKCQEYLNIIENILLNEAKSDLESEVFYLTNEAIIHKYIAKCSFGKTNEKAIKLCGIFYSRAVELSKGLPELNPYRILLYLNLSKFYYMIEENPEKAISFAGQIVDVINNKLKEMPFLEENIIKMIELYFSSLQKKIPKWQKKTIFSKNGDKKE